jgi:uncharacterized protein YbjT (DUF2867 family)
MILVTGATGTTGRELVKLLSSQGAKVRALVRNPGKAAELKLPNVEIVPGDLSKPATLEAAFKGAEKLLLLTNAEPAQVELQHNALEAAKRAGLKHVVKISAMGADVKSPVSLGRWHGQTEEELKKSGLPYTILQPHYFMQNLMGSAQSIKAQGAFYGAMKDGKISLIDARDIAAVAAKVLTSAGHEGKTYVLTGPEPLSMADLAGKLAAAAGKPIKYVDLPPEQLKKGLSEAGMPEWFATDMVSMQTFFATGAAAGVSPSVQELKGSPGRTFDAFAREVAGQLR